MITMLPKLYKLASIQQLSMDTLDRRSKAIRDLMPHKSMEWHLDCVRLLLGKKLMSQTFLGEFKHAFTVEDPLIDFSDNELETKVLATAILGEKINQNDFDSIRLAMAFKAGSFGKISDDMFIPDLSVLADELLEVEGIKKRTISEPTECDIFPAFDDGADSENESSEYLQKVSDYMKSFITTVNGNQLLFSDKIKVLEEESSIHWWLFRGFCNLANKPVKDLNKISAPITLAKELSTFINILPAPSNCDQFMKKMFSNVIQDSSSIYSIKEVIEATIAEYKNFEPKKEILDQYGNLMPLGTALIKAIESDGNAGWVVAFQNITGVQADLKFSATEFGKQFFIECILSKS